MPKKYAKFKILKTGTHTDKDGKVIDFTADTLTTIANNYNNQAADKKHDAPLRPGDHSKSFVDTKGNLVMKPSYGWVKSLSVDGDNLFAEAVLTPTAVKSIKDGDYKHVSAGLKGFNLDHIALLGSVNPAVKGLGGVELSEAAIDGYEFSEEINQELETFQANNPEFVIEFAVDDGKTLKQLNEEQGARSKEYGISIKENYGVISKPDNWSSLKDEDFGDPVHYMFPMQDKANVIASISQFNRYDLRNGYSDTERQIIAARLIAAGIKYKLKMEPDRIYFSDSDKDNKAPETNQDNNSQSINLIEGSNMDPKVFIAAVVADVTSEFNEETATKVQGFISKHIGKLSAKADDDKKTDGDEKSFSDSEEFKAQQAKIEKLEADIRAKEHKEFVENSNLVGKFKTLGTMALEVAHIADSGKESTFEFSEGDKTEKLNADAVIKGLIKGYPELTKNDSPEFTEPETTSKGIDDAVADYNKLRS